mmetsp:Transcript_17892/g.44598  ORF Transcript_17892/g.44598 Transcript_17892/m.44598 type:complete len:229 (+) Transcript_17892:625-1311(+)
MTNGLLQAPSTIPKSRLNLVRFRINSIFSMANSGCCNGGSTQRLQKSHMKCVTSPTLLMKGSILGCIQWKLIGSDQEHCRSNPASEDEKSNENHSKSCHLNTDGVFRLEKIKTLGCCVKDPIVEEIGFLMVCCCSICRRSVSIHRLQFDTWTQITRLPDSLWPKFASSPLRHFDHLDHLNSVSRQDCEQFLPSNLVRRHLHPSLSGEKRSFSYLNHNSTNRGTPKLEK